MDDLKEYLLGLGVSKVGYANIDGLANDFIDLPHGISLVLKLPTEIIEYVNDDDYESYWIEFRRKVNELKEISIKGEEYIKDKGYGAFALTMDRNECDMKKLLSVLPYKTIATKSGMGWIGRSALFVTQEYGSAVILSGILTNAPLDFDDAVTDSYCDDCENCQKACPVDAINPKKWNDRLKREDIIDIETCRDYIIDQYNAGLGCSKCMSKCRLTEKYIGR